MGNNEEFYTMEGWATSLRDTSLSTMLSTMLNFFCYFIFLYFTQKTDKQQIESYSPLIDILSFIWACVASSGDSVFNYSKVASFEGRTLTGACCHLTSSLETWDWGLTLPNNLCPLSLKLPINTLCHYRWLLSYLIIERKFLTFPIKLHICRRFTIFRSWIGSLNEDLF